LIEEKLLSIKVVKLVILRLFIYLLFY